MEGFHGLDGARELHDRRRARRDSSRTRPARVASAVDGWDPAAVRRLHPWAFQPRAGVYWTDLVATAVVGWGAFAVAVALAGTVGWGWGWLAASIVSTLALLRGALFIHELTHLRPGAVPGFDLGWHLLVGLPLMLPSLMYVGPHNDHHRRSRYATAQDPEYLPLAHWSRLRIAGFVVGVAFVPLLLVLRWGVLALPSRALPPLRRVLVERASTLAINPDYRRPLPRGTRRRRWWVLETATTLVFGAVVVALVSGWLPIEAAAQWLVVGAGILLVNQVRTLAAHGYSNAGHEVDARAQMLDSTTLRGVPVLTALVAPVGERYHALHHWLPDVPYHRLAALHRRLLEELPADAAYRQTERAGILPQVFRLLSEAGASGAA